MNNKCKRITVGFVLPIIIAVFICGIFYYKNAHQSLIKGNKEYEAQQQVEGVVLTKGNWSEYFEYVDEYVMDKDEEGNVVNVRLDAYYRMKDEYYKKLDTVVEEVIFIVNSDGTVKEYDILDPKTGEWDYTGKNAKLESEFYKVYLAYMDNNRDMCFWDAETNKAEVSENSIWYDMEENNLILSIESTEVLAADGKIQFK